MIAKRLAAIAIAIALIAGAWALRTEVIDDDGDASADQPADVGVLLCVDELADICRGVGDALGLDVATQPAGVTLDELGAAGSEPALWLTFDGFPEMLNTVRTTTDGEPIAYSATQLGSSPIAAIGRSGSLAALVDACGDPVDLGCLAEQSDLKRSVSSIDSGIGLLSVSAAVAAKTGDAFSLDGDQLFRWARLLQRSSARVPLSGGTAVGTLQTRPTAADVALGVEAELVASRAAEFDVLYASPMARANVVLVVPSGLRAPPELDDLLTEALTAQRWEAPRSSEADALPTPEQMLAIRAFWKTL